MALTNKTPPQNIDAEQSVLGALLLEPDAVPRVARFLRPDDFYLEAHRQIYEAILALDEAGQPVDLITVTTWLQDAGVLERTGGVTYVASLAGLEPSAANVEYHARIVEEKALLRHVIQVATRIASRGYEGGEDAEKLMDEAERMLFELAARRSASVFVTIRDILQEIFAYIEDRYRNQGKISGITSGFIDLDRLLCGFQPGDLVIVAGRPAMGKTSLGLSIAHQVALQYNQPVAVFSLEMSRSQLVQRVLCAEAMVDQQKVRSGHLSESDWARLAEAAGRLAPAPLYIDDAAMLSPRQLRAKARRLQAEKGLGLIVVDYLQLMQGARRVENRQQEIAEISRSLKGIAKDLHVPVLALAQLSRSVESRQDKRPIMSDLRESGSIEQDADVVMFIYRDEYYRPDTEKRGIAEIIVAKQRNGPTGLVELAFLKEYTRFMNLAREAPEEPSGESD
ncbi:replicative DNA helicase [Desulfotomaculum copahuensis]|uniref:Replicative DNA helicase n=1 Tax=Desulfotomaculum copahuensis TaxID=1838280 RepID=A0A1B7LD69_9FIRM|nr:replicative DNA helicase [Desulfotomaculum copahuensis]OAT80863.1 replicative DNA helicase [Desulfotomaculum copahuensis]